MMDSTVTDTGPDRLERSCEAWIRSAPAGQGLERIEAFFTGHAYDPHRHDTYAIGLTLSGVQCFDYRGARADSLTGNAIVVHPDEEHNGRAGIETGFCYRMIYIPPHRIAAALDGRASGLPFLPQAVSNDPRLSAAVRAALGSFEGAYEAMEADQVVQSLAEALLALDASAQMGRPSPVSVAAVDRARQLLDADYARVVRSEELEDATGLDRYSLARSFRARLGTSPYRYLTLRRLDHARRSMKEGLSLAEIAADSGFADQSHMTRQFKAAYGLSPGRWRALHLPA